MARLPIVDGDEENWGAILNEFLSVSHRADGAPKDVVTVQNIIDFGVTADDPLVDLVDNTTHFQAAIDAAENGVLYVPAGIYQTGELFLPSNIMVIGDGPTSTLLFTAIKPDDDPKRGSLFSNRNWESGNDNIAVRGLRLFGNRDDKNNLNTNAVNLNRGHAFNFRSASSCVLQELTIEEFVFDGIYLGSTSPDIGDNARGSSCNIVRANHVIGNGRNGITLTRGTDNQILNNYLSANNKGVTGTDNPNAYRAGAIDVEPNGDFEDVSRTLIHGNRLVNNHANGIQLLVKSPSIGMVVSENFVHASGEHGIAAARTRNMTVHGNIVSSSVAVGMALGMGTGVISAIVTSNQVFDNGSHGILINGDISTRCVVANNVAYQNGTEGEDHRGVTIAAGKDMVVTGNIALENTGVEQISLPADNGAFSTNLGRPAGIGSFRPTFARTGEALATTTATRDVVFRRDDDQVWLLNETKDGLFLRNLTIADTGSRIILEKDLAPLLARLQKLEAAAGA